MKGSLGRIVWKDHLEGSFGRIIWKDHLEGSLGKMTWKDHLEGSLGRIAWKDRLRGSLEGCRIVRKRGLIQTNTTQRKFLKNGKSQRSRHEREGGRAEERGTGLRYRASGNPDNDKSENAPYRFNTLLCHS